MKSILLIGGGGHCAAAVDVIELEGSFQIAGIVRRKSDGTEPVLGYPVLGDDADLPRLLAEIPHALVAVGQIATPALRIRLFERLKSLKTSMPVIVSPRAYVSRRARLEEGTLVGHGAIINAGARIGVNGIINSLALVEHDARVGRHCHISTGARVNGGAIIEDGCFVGSGAVLREGVRVGANSVIGAGCFVAHDVEANSLLKSQP